MKIISAYIQIVRPGNVLMTGAGVALGAWLGQSTYPFSKIAFLIAAGMAATGFGNVINDIFDIASDRISHPDRPLPKETITIAHASIFAVILACAAVVAAWIVTPLHAIAVLIPVTILLVYAARLKATVLLGNTLVSFLVAYPIIFGALNAPEFPRVLLPAFLAFLLNFAREIIKDMQDTKGDTAQGIQTSAILPQPLLRSILITLSATYLLTLFLPIAIGHFGWVYALVAAALALPLHILWSRHLLKSDWVHSNGSMSRILKLEMLSGLLALSLDQLFLKLL